MLGVRPVTDIAEFFDSEPGGPRCFFARMTFTDEQSEKLAAAFNHPEVKSSRITAVLRQWGFTVSPFTVARHRRGDCTCPR